MTAAVWKTYYGFCGLR